MKQLLKVKKEFILILYRKNTFKRNWTEKI